MVDRFECDGDVQTGAELAGKLPHQAVVIGTVRRSGLTHEGLPAEPMTAGLVELANGTWAMVRAGEVRLLPGYVKRLETTRGMGLWA